MRKYRIIFKIIFRKKKKKINEKEINGLHFR